MLRTAERVCIIDAGSDHPVSVSTVSQDLSYPLNIYQGGRAAIAGRAGDAHQCGTCAKRSSKVLILQSTHLERASEVVGSVDAHEERGNQENALATLRTNQTRRQRRKSRSAQSEAPLATVSTARNAAASISG